MWVVSKEEKKRVLRDATLSRRNSLSKSERLLWSRLIQARALQLPQYIASRSVVLYSAVRNEVATDDILEHSLKQGRGVFYPKMGSECSVDLIQVLSSAELQAGRFGILEPTGLELLAEADHEGLVVFVPGVAFDIRGNRLGRGQGWYDRLLARLGGGPLFVALAFEFQVVEEVPSESWDQKVHYVVTEKRCIDCAESSAASNQVF
jgi:5-formyltetrahydrofolate cyclo-ligase